MPMMSGIDATRALKTLMPMVPVIIFSQYSDAFSEEEADPPTTLERLVDQIERIREEPLTIQRKLEKMESANTAGSDGPKKH